ncbi:MAG TPA: S8 family serine peptidase [Saprospiraceae bacterium]|nr:S8 family serine peptidase [Saprospiraceae bacterium]
MNRLHTFTMIYLAMGLFFSLSAQAQDVSFRPEVLDDALEAQILEDDSAYLRAYILLKDQVDIPALKQEFASLRAGKEYRTRRVVRVLKETADRTQASWLDLLAKAEAVKPESIRPFWVTNMILVEARGSYLAQLSQRPDVLRIEQEWKAELLDKEVGSPAPLMAPNGREAGLTAINAHKLWNLGYTGYGTKVMVIDSDVDFDHRALSTQFYYHNAPIEQVFTAELSGQICFSHGTNVTGLIVGLDRQRNDTIGVAFNAKYLNGPVAFFDSEGNQCQLEGRVLSAVENLQFALDPDGNPNTSTDVPDVINNSYGTTTFSTRDCQNLSLRNIYSSLDAAGISLVFSSGNEGPGEESLTLQASLNFDEFVPFVVGAVDNRNVIADFSSRGPTVCIDGPNSIKPEVVAPGVDVRTAKPFNNYEEVPGTSFSTPYVSGAVLLLKEAFPNLPGRELNRALYETARDLGDAGDDNIYGNGLIDVYAAYNWLIDQGNTPTPARQSNNDAIVLNLKTRTLDCNRMIQSFMTVANNGSEPITSLDVTFRIPDRNMALGTIQWEGNIAPGEIQEIILDPVNALVGNYVVQANVSRVNGRVDLRSLDNVYKAPVEVVEDPVLPAVTIAGQEICKGGQSIIFAEADMAGTIRWYNSLTGGAVLAEGDQIQLDNVQRDTTLYVSVSSANRVGLDNPEVGPNTFLSQTAGLVFDAYANFTLKSVKVFAEKSGVRIIQLKDDRGNVQQKVIPLTTAGEHTLDLDFEVQPGSDYELLMTVGDGLAVTTNDTDFPHQIDNIMEITRSTGTVATFYAYFYDWEVEYDYVCGRVAVPIRVDEEGEALQISFTADKDTVMMDENGQAFVQFTTLTDGLVNYEWSFGDGYTSILPNPGNSYDAPGIYTVTLNGTDVDGCNSIAASTIVVTGPASSTSAQTQLEQKIRVFPNPSREYVNLDIQFDEAKQVQYRLVDLFGKTYQQASPGRISEWREQLDISRLPAGTYLLIVVADGVQVGKRLVKF